MSYLDDQIRDALQAEQDELFEDDDDMQAHFESIKFMFRGKTRQAGLNEGPPMSVSSPPWMEGRPSMGSPTPLKIRPRRLSLENASCTWCPKNSTSSPLETPLEPAKTWRVTSSSRSLMTWA